MSQPDLPPGTDVGLAPDAAEEVRRERAGVVAVNEAPVLTDGPKGAYIVQSYNYDSLGDDPDDFYESHLAEIAARAVGENEDVIANLEGKAAEALVVNGASYIFEALTGDDDAAFQYTPYGEIQVKEEGDSYEVTLMKGGARTRTICITSPDCDITSAEDPNGSLMIQHQGVSCMLKPNHDIDATVLNIGEAENITLKYIAGGGEMEVFCNGRLVATVSADTGDQELDPVTGSVTKITEGIKDQIQGAELEAALTVEGGDTDSRYNQEIGCGVGFFARTTDGTPVGTLGMLLLMAYFARIRRASTVEQTRSAVMSAVE